MHLHGDRDKILIGDLMTVDGANPSEAALAPCISHNMFPCVGLCFGTMTSPSTIAPRCRVILRGHLTFFVGLALQLVVEATGSCLWGLGVVEVWDSLD